MSKSPSLLPKDSQNSSLPEKSEEELLKDSQELAIELLELTKDMDIEPGRNDLCYCFSGKKYKKWCMHNKGVSDAKDIELEEFCVVPDTDPEFFQYGISDKDYKTAASCCEAILSESEEEQTGAAEDLDILLKKYPKHPILNTLLALKE